MRQWAKWSRLGQQSNSSEKATGSLCLSPSRAVSASFANVASIQAANDPIQTVPTFEKLGAIRPPDYSAYSHLLGGFAGGQAEYLRVPYADVGPAKVPEGLTDEQVLFLSDILPTGYMAAEFCNIQPGDTIAVWGCGPVGQLAIASAFLLGASRVIAIDTVPERMALAQKSGAETLDFQKDDIYERIQDLTKGRGADACIDAVGTEPEMTARKIGRRSDQSCHFFRNRPTPRVARSNQLLPKLRDSFHRRRLCGNVDQIPMGSATNRGLTFRMAQTPVQH